MQKVLLPKWSTTYGVLTKWFSAKPVIPFQLFVLAFTLNSVSNCCGPTLLNGITDNGINGWIESNLFRFTSPTYCYHSVNGICNGLAQSDPIKRLPLYVIAYNVGFWTLQKIFIWYKHQDINTQSIIYNNFNILNIVRNAKFTCAMLHQSYIATIACTCPMLTKI